MQGLLDSLFGTTRDVGWAQECARAALILIYGLVLVRVAGRRVFGKWSALDIVVSIVVGSNLSRALTGSAPLFATLLATALLMALHWGLARAGAQWPWLSRLVEGQTLHLARDGVLEAAQARRAELSEADLEEALRQSGVERIEDTRLVTLEPSGKISVLKRQPG